MYAGLKAIVASGPCSKNDSGSIKKFEISKKNLFVLSDLSVDIHLILKSI